MTGWEGVIFGTELRAVPLLFGFDGWTRPAGCDFNGASRDTGEGKRNDHCDEPRFAEAAREMRERADFIIPYFNNQFRFDKPPLTYWFQVASYRVFGENDFAARFPTAVAAALVALVLFSWGKRVRNEKVGWWAAIIFTLSLQTFIHGKAAVADMWLVLFVTIAHWAGWNALRQK